MTIPTLVEQLRALARCEHGDMTLGDDAADEIERLHAELAIHRQQPSNPRQLTDEELADCGLLSEIQQREPVQRFDSADLSAHGRMGAGMTTEAADMPEWPCWCDEQGVGEPGVTCGDCPRDYGHRVSPPPAQPATDPLDTPLPCDVKVGNGTHRKGTSLRTLVNRMQMLHEAAFGPELSQAEKDANLAVLQGAAQPAQAEPAEFHNPWRASLENCISGDNYLRASEYRDLIEELDELYQLRAAQADPWRDAIDEALVVAHLGVATEPYDDLNKLLQWHHDIWLDPAVSSDAQALIDRGAAEERARAAQPAQAEPTWTEADKRAQDGAWTQGGGFYQRLDGEDHACMSLSNWRTFMAVCASLAGHSAAQPKREPMTGDVLDAVSNALKRAWQLGKIYWQQIDIENYSANKKSDATHRKFMALIDETRSTIERLTLGEQG